MFRIRSSIPLQMIKASLHLLIDHARTEICETAGTAITKTIHEVMAPFALAVCVVLMGAPGRTSRSAGIHTTLRHRLRLIDWWTGLVALRNRGTLFAITCLGLWRTVSQNRGAIGASDIQAEPCRYGIDCMTWRLGLAAAVADKLLAAVGCS
jgi:hypothetical protein